MSSPDAQGRAGDEATPAIYPGHRVIAMFPYCDEREKLSLLVQKIRPGLVDKWMPVDDGSTDDGSALLRQHGIEPLTQPTRRGIGAAIKAVVRHARANGYDILVVMAGNNKDDPGEIPRLLEPILEHGVDYVQGSRFLEGGSSPHLPVFRRIAIQLLSLVFRLYSGQRCTDLTNGFRAYRLGLFDDARVDIEQEWLDDYEYEYYVHWKAYTLGYKVAEVPVTKTYPGVKGVEYSKIKPIIGWWRMLRPFILLALGIKK